MEQREIERVLAAHQLDTASLSLIVDRGNERIYELMVPEADAIAHWRRLRAVLPECGYWPVVGWGSRWLDEDISDGLTLQLVGSTRDILMESEAVNPEQWMEAQEQYWLGVQGKGMPADLYKNLMGEWPEQAKPYTEFVLLHDMATREPVPRVPFDLVPVTASWQVPAVLRFSTTNVSCTVHVAMARRWHDLYGAEIVGLGPDRLEMHVARPPTTCEAAEALAKEQFLYCEDIDLALLALAAGLLHGTAWYFWWD